MPDIMKFIMDEKLIETDPNGYLLNLDDWDEKVATALAKEEGIELTDAHWEVLNYLRDYYSEYGSSPNVRLLMKGFAKVHGSEKGTQKYLYDLFPTGPSRQGCRIAGLPLAPDCIDFPG